VAIEAVVFADSVGVPRFTFCGVIGGLAARGDSHRLVHDLLGVEPKQGGGVEQRDVYPDPSPCLERLRQRGLRLGLARNASRDAYARLELDVDIVASSADWGVERPAPGFFDGIAEACGFEARKIAYVGDRVDDDVIPARAAGMLAIRVRRGPWGHLHDPSEGTPQVPSPAELPAVIAHA
jgi:FMN phosphatase YigB (HAD superfamily)